jgi:cell division septation protein DedD
MNYQIFFNKKSAILIFAGGLLAGTLLFVSGYKLGLDRGASRARAELEKQSTAQAVAAAGSQPSPAPASPEPPAVEPGVASQTAGEPAQSAVQPDAGSQDGAPRPAVETSTSKAGYSVQIGAFQSEDAAQQLQQKFSGRGYSTYLFQGRDSAGQDWYAVRIGRFRELEPATRVAVTFTLKEKAPAHVRPIDQL